MTSNFNTVIELAFKREVIRKLVFSRPKESEITKVSGRMVAHRGRRILTLEYSLPGNTVKQENITEAELQNKMSQLLSEYRQTNLITTVGDAERKVSKDGKEVLLGSDKLERKLKGEVPSFVCAIEELDKKKNYILSGDEDFLKALGISDKSGRVHDKKQGKYRQINRFLEHIETIYKKLPKEGMINIFDLCSGKSYLSFAVYYYFTYIKKREVKMLGIDLKRDVILECSAIAKELRYSGMKFITDDVRNTPKDVTPDLLISLHACDIATDIVIDTAVDLGAKIILSTPCCHRYLNDKITASSLSFITKHPHLKNKLAEAATDALRAMRLESFGYDVSVLELTDPENTPKNTLIKAVLNANITDSEKVARHKEYEDTLSFLIGENSKRYLNDI